jgi:beta-lactamase regulating signal transducer with metallopeptidase domain
MIDLINILNGTGDSFCRFALAMLIQSGILIVLLYLIDLLIRKHVRAVFRYCIWMLVFVKLVLPVSLSSPISMGQLFGDKLTINKIEIPAAAENNKGNRKVMVETPADAAISKKLDAAENKVRSSEWPRKFEEVQINPTQKAENVPPELITITWQAVVFLAWLVGLLVLSVLLFQRFLFVKGLLAQSDIAHGQLDETLQQCSRQVGIRRNIELRLSKNMLSPAACGLFKPVILMPASLLENLSREKLRAVLIHELAHIKRGDLWVNFIQTILQMVYFYNPLLWFANAVVRSVREKAVDEMVLTKLGDEAESYSNILIDIAEMAFSKPHFSLRLVGVVESKKALSGRIKHILSRPFPKTAKLGMAGLIAIIITAAILLPMAKAASKPPEFIIKGTVTDAETGRPIGGAKVGDVEKYAEGKYCTTTDVNGNYSYKTWYEEHNLKCEAAGYKTKNEILLTKLFGREKEKVIDFQLKINSKSDVEMLSASVKVTDEDGKPVEGAEITIDGLQSNGSGYGWDSRWFGQAPQVSTNAQGVAKVPYPKYIEEKLKPEEICFKVNHPEYCPVDQCNYRVDGQSPPVVLRKGAIVKLSAYIGSKDNVITDIVPQISGMGRIEMLDGSYWKQDNDGRLTNNKIPPGPHYLRAVYYFPKDERIHFSDTVFLEARKGETSQFNLELKPGVRLDGKLDNSVPRPIRNGRVVVRAYREKEENEDEPLSWMTWRDVKDDGTFVIESLPPGMVKIIAICDGFTSKNPPKEGKNVISEMSKPQIFELKSAGNEVEIAMEPTATCQVTVLDDKSRPIKDATVIFSPNVLWGDGTRIFAQRSDSEGFVRSGSKFDYEKQWEKYKTDAFAATTNEKGVAIVRNLPGYSQHFAVFHSDYELPIKTNYGHSQRYRVAELSVGKTSTVTVTMQKKGKEFLTTVFDRENNEPQIDPNNREDMKILTGEKGEQGALSGKVVDEKGNSLKDVLVNETYTDANGYFYLGGFEPEQKTVEIRFSRENFTPKYLIRQPLGIKDTVVVLNNKTYFEGMVSGSDGKPVPEAIIKAVAGPKHCEGVYVGEVPTECKSDKNGYYRLYVQADIYDIQVKAEQGVVRLPNIKINKNEAKKLDLKLSEAVTFLAKVIDSRTKKPVSGLRLFSWLHHPGIEGVSDSNGLVRIPNMLPGKFELGVESKEYCRWWSEDCLSEWSRYNPIVDEMTGWQRNFDKLDFDLKNEMQPVTIIVEKGVKITGKVIDPLGNPVAGATTTLVAVGTGGRYLLLGGRYSFTTDANGQFEMMVPASKKAKYNLVAHDGKYEEGRNWANGVLEPITTNPGDVIDNVIIKLTEPATVKGTVVDGLGNPVPNRQVTASAFDKVDNGCYEPTVRTDANGNFEIKFIRPGKHYVQAYEGTSQMVTVEAGQILEGVKLVLPK